jgi:hypothetical protein
MKLNTLSLKIILESIIKETGDLAGIISYDYTNGEFTTEEGWKVIVKLSHIKEPDYSYLNLPFRQRNVKAVEYTIEGEQSQYKKTTYSKLIKILKTVSDITIEYINNNPNLQALVFFAANKDPDQLLSNTDPQKSAIYKAIILKQISQLGQKWIVKDIDIHASYNGFILYKNS